MNKNFSKDEMKMCKTYIEIYSVAWTSQKWK